MAGKAKPATRPGSFERRSISTRITPKLTIIWEARCWKSAIGRVPKKLLGIVFGLQPSFAGAHRNPVNPLAAQGQLEQAEYLSRQTVFHEPGYALAYFDYGVASAGADRYDQARTLFETAVCLDPNPADAHVSLADMFASQGTTSRADSHYQQALALNAELGAAHLGPASALVSLDKRSEAVHYLEMATRSNEPGTRSAAQEVPRGSPC